MPAKRQVISLGAGFDTTYFCMQQQFGNMSNWQYVEIDYPDVIERKVKLAQFHNLFFGSMEEISVEVVGNHSVSSAQEKGEKSVETIR